MTKVNSLRNKKVMSLVASGLSYTQVGVRLGISRQAVAGVVYRNRTTKPDRISGRGRRLSARPVIARGVVYPNAHKAAEAFGVHVNYVRRLCFGKTAGFRYGDAEAQQ